MKMTILLSGMLLFGCSHQLSRNKSNPDLPFAVSLVEEVQKEVQRRPASLSVSDMEDKSPRRVYFSALYHQYLTLSNHLGESSQVQSCPQFHHDKIETDSSRVSSFTFYRTEKGEAPEKEFFPETAFTQNFSLKDHHQIVFEEIKVLCEDGVSDNYYKFDNLITHYAEKRSFHQKPDSMRAVLKIPVFANYYLLQMLRPSQVQETIHPEEKKVISLTQTHWFERYVAEAHRVRNNLIKNKMVQR